MALYFKSLKEFSLFDLMMSISAMIQVPILIPLILGLFVKRTPEWAPWITVLVGLFVSWFVFNVFTADVAAAWMGLEPLTRREATDFNLILTIGAQVFLTGGFFCATALFYREVKDRHKFEKIVFLRIWRRRSSPALNRMNTTGNKDLSLGQWLYLWGQAYCL